MFRSGLVGFTLHGSLSHYYYQFCEVIMPSFCYTRSKSLLLLPNWLLCSFQELFPFQDWWVVPVKVAFDQTAWAALWNSIYFIAVGFLRLESPATIFSELKATFVPMLTVRRLLPFLTTFVFGWFERLWIIQCDVLCRQDGSFGHSLIWLHTVWSRWNKGFCGWTVLN